MLINNVSLSIRGYSDFDSLCQLPSALYLFICEIARSMTENTKESDSYFEFPPLINV